MAGRWWLFRNFLSREIQGRYLGSAVGLGWVLLHPAVMLAIYGFVFAYIFKVRLPGADGAGGAVGYVIFVAVCLWPWFLFQEGLQRATTALAGQAALIRKAAFPRELVVLSVIAAAVAVHLSGFILVLLLLMLFAGYALPLAGLPLGLAMLAAIVMLTVAFGLLLALLQLVWRDVEHISGPFLAVFFYATPILYPLSMVPTELAEVLQLNPLAWVFTRLRDGLLAGQALRATDLAVVAIAALALWLVWLLFRRIGPHVEDLL